MPDSYDLSHLEPKSFEHLVNALALRVLGAGHTGFGPGPDGGRDGYFEGEAPYPSTVDRWSGRWVIQSKFHKPKISGDEYKWLLNEIKSELAAFQDPASRRVWPDIWIVATNIDPSGKPQTGCFDKALQLVKAARPALAARFHIWGGTKILNLLSGNEDIAKHYGHFLTPGHVLATLQEVLGDARAEVSEIIQYLIVKRFEEQKYTKLEQAGSTDNRPGIQSLFTDLPILTPPYEERGMGAQQLAKSIAQNHKIANIYPDTPAWLRWKRFPSRARVWFVKGGPGQGKSTLAQFLCQIQRAALILGPDIVTAHPQRKILAEEVRSRAEGDGLWPTCPRIPVSIELKDFAQWYGGRQDSQPRGVLTYLADRLTIHVEQTVYPGTLKRAFGTAHWLFIFDGLDEVPADVKDDVAREVCGFVDDVLVSCKSDALTVCSSRPQGYAGQFASLDACAVELQKLSPKEALECAKPVLSFDRSDEDYRHSFEILTDALSSPAVRELMTTPLQSHFMAVIVRDGHKPPERKWMLFTSFYQVIKKREESKRFPDKELMYLLRHGEKLLKALHNKLGFELHARAETSRGAQATLNRLEFAGVVRSTVERLKDRDIDQTVKTLMSATEERLMLVTTPDTKDEIRFDIRPLQEFFAAEFLYESVDSRVLGIRLRVIGEDSHWQEVMHFLLSALVENDRVTDLMVATTVLAEINEQSENSDERAFHRRMALGGAITARLLGEGVLEQDIGVRQIFRKCLEPALGTLSRELVNLLSEPAGYDSAMWLYDMIIDSLKERAESENVVGAAVLLHSLPCRHSRVREVSEIFAKSSVGFRIAVFSLLNNEHRRAERPHPAWAYTVALETGLDERWLELGSDGLAAVVSFCISDQNAFRSALIERGFETDLAGIVSDILCKEQAAGDVVRSEEKFGIIRAKYITLPTYLMIENMHEKLLPVLERSGGFLGLIGLILNHANVGDEDSGSRVIDYVKENRGIFESLPPFINRFAPYRGPFGPQEVQIPGESLGKSLRFLETLSIDLADMTPDDWEATIEVHPFIAFGMFGQDNFWSTLTTQNQASALQTAEYCNRFINVLLRKPDLLLRGSGFWGKLLEICPDREEEVRSRLLTCVACPMPNRFGWMGADIHLLKLHLPLEAVLLPTVVRTVVEYIYQQEIRTHDENGIMHRIRPKLKDMLPDIGSLFDLLRDDEMSSNIKAAAAMLYLMHPEANETGCRKCETLIVDSYEPGANRWYLNSAGGVLHERVTAGDLAAIRVMGKLIAKGQADLKARLELEPILERWRQRSRAPVSAAQLANAWE
jgi:hypothetical protein